jgi:hypothetical protein
VTARSKELARINADTPPVVVAGLFGVQLNAYAEHTRALFPEADAREPRRSAGHQGAVLPALRDCVLELSAIAEHQPQRLRASPLSSFCYLARSVGASGESTLRQGSLPIENAHGLSKMVPRCSPLASGAAFFAAVVACACGDVTARTPTSSGGSGAGGAAGGPSPSGMAGFAGTGGMVSVLSQCIFNKSGDPIARFDTQDVGVIKVACHGGVRATVVLVGDDAGQGFDWTSTIVPANGALMPDPPSGSACAGYGPTDAGVVVRFPDDATPGEMARGTLVIDTTVSALTPVRFDVNAELVETRFSLDPAQVDFGTVAIGQSVSATVTVTNLGSAPLSVLEPQAAVNAPFRYVDWAPRGEDQFVIPTVPPGGKQKITVYFEPTARGNYATGLELTSFPGADPPECGAPQPLALHGSAGP